LAQAVLAAEAVAVAEVAAAAAWVWRQAAAVVEVPA
jgi:hypothetical protein